MWLSAEERHKHCQLLCKWLQHNCIPCKQCNTRVVLMVGIPGKKEWKKVCNATHCQGDGKCVILRQRVRGSIRPVRAVRNPRVFQMEPRVVADKDCEKVLDSANSSSLLSSVFNTINNKFDDECFDQMVRLLNTHQICQ